MPYYLLDAARMEELFDTAKEKTEPNPYWCLYKGESAETLGNVAPYLFTTWPPPFLEWLFADGWGNAWGVFVLTRARPDVLYQHLRKFLIVNTEAGRQLYFRFYDPRVLRRFLPTCSSTELQAFFGPIRYFLVEDDDAEYGLSFWLQDGKLQSQRMPRAEAEQAYWNYLKS